MAWRACSACRGWAVQGCGKRGGSKACRPCAGSGLVAAAAPSASPPSAAAAAAAAPADGGGEHVKRAQPPTDASTASGGGALVAVVGGGIGGPALALALQQRGVAVALFEAWGVRGR